MRPRTRTVILNQCPHGHQASARPTRTSHSLGGIVDQLCCVVANNTRASTGTLEHTAVNDLPRYQGESFGCSGG